MEWGGGLILLMGKLGKVFLGFLGFHFWDFLCRVYYWFLLLLFRFANFDIDIKIYYIIIFFFFFGLI